MKIKYAILKYMIAALAGTAFVLPSSRCLATEVKIKDNRFFVDNKPFFINAVGYAPWRPGQWPGTDKVDLKIIEYDFKKIKEVGFNTIRTWDALNEEELKLSLKYNLYVIQGIWIDPNHDFSDKQWQDMQLERIKEVVSYSKRFPNVLFYLIITEPKTKAILYAGQDETKNFFKRIIDIVHSLDKRPVSMDSWLPIGFLDHSMWDIITFNAFMFTPESINKVLGFDGYIEFIKQNYAKDKPLFVGETGGFSVSKKKENTLGFGGNSEEQQSKGNIASMQACINKDVAGVCTVSWIDTWHYPKDPDVHNDEPWEWDGIIALEDKDNPYGRPRQVFYDLKKYFKKAQFKPRKIDQSPKAQLTLTPAKDIFNPNDKIIINIYAKYRNNPLKNKVIKYGFFTEQNWQEQYGETVTDQNGYAQAISKLPINNETGYILAFASIKDNKFKAYDLNFIKINFHTEDKKYFWVYKDKEHPLTHYNPSGWIGDYKTLTFEDDFTQDVYSGDTCLKITYKGSADETHWAGIFWQNPLNNWGEKKGGYNLIDRKTLTFWTKGEKGTEIIADVISGCIQSGNYPDSSYNRIGPITFTKEWKQYKIDLTNKDLSYISGGFGFIVKAKDNPQGCIFYLDDIRYE